MKRDRKFKESLDENPNASKLRRRISVTIPAYTEETLYALAAFGKFKDQSDVVSKALVHYFESLDQDEVLKAFARWEKECP